MPLKVTFAIFQEPGGEKYPKALSHGNVFRPRMPELLSHSRLPSTSPRESTFEHASNMNIHGGQFNASNMNIHGGQFNITINYNRGPLPSCALSNPLMYPVESTTNQSLEDDIVSNLYGSRSFHSCSL